MTVEAAITSREAATNYIAKRNTLLRKLNFSGAFYFPKRKVNGRILI